MQCIVYYVINKKMCVVCLRVCRHADAESAVSSGTMHVLRHAGLGSKKVACRTAQSLCSLHGS